VILAQIHIPSSGGRWGPIGLGDLRDRARTEEFRLNQSPEELAEEMALWLSHNLHVYSIVLPNGMLSERGLEVVSAPIEVVAPSFVRAPEPAVLVLHAAHLTAAVPARITRSATLVSSVRVCWVVKPRPASSSKKG
jgi:hypothetical protein